MEGYYFSISPNYQLHKAYIAKNKIHLLLQLLNNVLDFGPISSFVQRGIDLNHLDVKPKTAI